MKRITTTIALVTLLGTGTALAADAPPRDYSQPAMLAFTQEVLRQRAAERVDIDLGAIDIYHFGLRSRFFWLPFLAPLPGTRLSDTATLPSPFALTQTAIARSMPYMSDDDTSAAVKREIQRALKLDKKRAKVKVTATE